ncbi:MAG: MFS transporter [Holosporales bacterium]|jgi:MFS family permease|nr:MFS transporter [Holosporales bacterium]
MSDLQQSQKKKDSLSVQSGPQSEGFFSAFKTIPKAVSAVSFFGLFLGMSTTMVYSQIGMFLKTELHVDESVVAFVDGIVEFVSFVCRIFAGVISDYLCERKAILLIGCLATLFARSMLASAASSLMVTIIQSIERLGNGFQATTRDALIADVSKVESRAKSYGFSRSLKTIGSLLGPPVAIIIMYISCNNYRLVFCCAVIPVAISIICLFRIKPPKIASKDKRIKNPFQKKYLQSLDFGFWKIILLAFIFEIGHFSEVLLPIYASQYLSVFSTGFESMCVSFGQVLMSFPIGFYADRFGRATMIRICMICMICANLFFIFIESLLGVCLGAFLWGGQMTAIQGLFLSLISEKADKHVTATAIGIYCFMAGISYLLASTLAGQIWSNFGGKYAFIYSLFISCLALLASKPLLAQPKHA